MKNKTMKKGKKINKKGKWEYEAEGDSKKRIGGNWMLFNSEWFRNYAIMQLCKVHLFCIFNSLCHKDTKTPGNKGIPNIDFLIVVFSCLLVA